MGKYQLGTLEASEELIRDLYIDLRNKVNMWSRITMQTPQARMGYIGQHLTSVVTGFPGGKSGARGYDLIMDNNKHGEIKTCYRVDQLGACGDCNAVVSSLEKKCSICESINIVRKDDSKWLIGIQHDEEFAKMLEPYRYYFVLFEFEEINNPQNTNIVASIWEVDPTTKGFGYCIIDYYINIRANSHSKAPFNMWPHQLKFALTNPKLIYRSLISEEGQIKTEIFPSLSNSYIDELNTLGEYSRTRTITLDAAKQVLFKYNPTAITSGKNKKDILGMIEDIRVSNNISNSELCEEFADAIYLPLLLPKKDLIPVELKQYFNKLQ
ncbi:MAG TPA: MamI family restriction endonuclease [Clostridium sp.]|nr:MamI family restriction endonuclease [Clostridium sp.]